MSEAVTRLVDLPCANKYNGANFRSLQPRGFGTVGRPALLLLVFVLLTMSLTVLHPNRVTDVYADISTWSNSYGGVGSDSGRAIAETSDGGYIVAGKTASFGLENDDFWVLRLESNGNVLWEKSYGTSASEEAYSMKETSDGGYVVVGSTFSFDGTSKDVWLLKLDDSGIVEWEKSYGGGRHDVGNSVQQTSDGGYIVGASTMSFGSGEVSGEEYCCGIWVLKLDLNGNVEWEKSYGPTGTEARIPVKQTSDGGYVVVGLNYPISLNGGDFWVLKLDSAGNIEWEKAYGDYEDQPSSIEQTSDGGYIVAGVRDDYNGNTEIWTIKLDSSGDLEWQYAFGTDSGSFGTSSTEVTQTSEGGYILGGRASTDFWLFKLDSNGDVELQKTYGTADGLDRLSSIQETSDGGFIGTGLTLSPDSESIDLWVLKLDSEGNITDCDDADLVHDAEADVTETSSSPRDTSAVIEETESTVTDTSAAVMETNAALGDTCVVPPPVPEYGLQLLENVNDPSDGISNLNEELRAVASTDDESVTEINFRWISPSDELMRDVTVPITSAEDSFAPNEIGTWTIEADFGNNQILRQTLDISFFVLPESPIGAIAMILSSIGALGTFLYIRSKSSQRLE
jgi:hypothetical protein